MKGYASVILIILLLFVISPVRAQQVHHQQQITTGTPETFRLIDRDVSEGRISKQDALLNKFYAVFDQKKLNSRYRQGLTVVASSAPTVLKCFTPTVMDYQRLKSSMSSGAKNTIHSILASTIASDTRTYISPSKHFIIHFTTIDSTGNAVPPADNNSNGYPDYVEWLASYADSTWNCEVRDEGFKNPLINNQAYNIYIAAIGDPSFAVYGYTTPDNYGSTYIVINNDLGSSYFPPNSDPDGKVKGDLKVTIAHEFKHAIQYATNKWNGESGSWLEMDATMMEDVVFDPVDDYYNYLTSSSSIFENPQYSMYPGSYYQVSWALYFYQKYGIQFWKKTWDDIGATNDSMSTAMSNVLQNYNDSFGEDFTQSEMWHYASGARSYPNYGFKDKANYPTSLLAYNYSSVPSKFLPRYYLNPMSAEYERIVPVTQDTGQVLITFFYNSDENGIGLLAWNKNNTTSEVIYNPKVTGNGMVQIRTPWRWGDLQEMGLVSTNASTQYGSLTRILVGANRLVYGDMDDNGTVNQADALLILDYVLGNKPIYSDTRMLGDLSDNGTISSYDATLLLRHELGKLPYFSKDTNHDGRGPEYSDFKTPSELASSGSVTNTTYSESPTSPFDTQSTPAITLANVPSDSQTDARIEVKLTNNTDSTFSSAYMVISFPPNIIKSVTLDTTGTVWKNSINKFSYTNGVFRMAIAEPDSFSSGVLGYLDLTASSQAQTNITVDRTNLDEIQNAALGSTLTIDIKPKTTVAVDKSNSNLPKNVKLGQNYPNPFNPTTIITYDLPRASHVLLTVYDITGRLVETLQNSNYAAGKHAVSFNGLQLASGMYFYRLQVKDGNKTIVKMHKMLLIK